MGGAVKHGRLELTWTYGEGLHRRATVEGLLDGFVAELRDLVAGCRTAGQEAISPADFPLAGLSRDQLERIARRVSPAGGGRDGA